jgi:hypothetical protein
MQLFRRVCRDLGEVIKWTQVSGESQRIMMQTVVRAQEVKKRRPDEANNMQDGLRGGTEGAAHLNSSEGALPMDRSMHNCSFHSEATFDFDHAAV